LLLVCGRFLLLHGSKQLAHNIAFLDTVLHEILKNLKYKRETSCDRCSVDIMRSSCFRGRAAKRSSETSRETVTSAVVEAEEADDFQSPLERLGQLVK